MMMKPARFLPAALLALGSALASGRAEIPAIVAQARAYLGSEAALNAVRSVHCSGTMSTGDNQSATIEMIFQKPYQQRITAITERTIPAKKAGEAPTVQRTIETTALDSYDGWQRVQDANDPTRWQLKLLSKEEIKRLRANTWQNLAYYGGLEKGGVKVEDLGEANVSGVACQKIAFRHAEDIVFTRYFDKSSGRLVLTETGQGGSIREEGEMIVSGIRFPKKFITYLKDPDGKERSITVTFDKITVNETFAASSFAIPAFSTR